jgi:hypothetical protein
MASPKRPSLAELLTPDTTQTEGQGAEIAAAPAASQADKPPADYARVGLYLPPAVAKEIKLVAFTHDRKAHDIYLEAVELVLQKYGRPSIRELSRKG